MRRYTWAAITVLLVGCSAAMGAPDGGDRLDASEDGQSDAGRDAAILSHDGGLEDGGAAGDDAGLDAGVSDAGSVDAGSDDGGLHDAGPPICLANDLVLAAVDPGLPSGTIAIYNASGATIRVDDTDYLLHEAPDSVLLRRLQPGVVLEPGALHRFPYPDSFTDGNASGEMALYRDTAIDAPASMVDFVCWGFGHSAPFTVRPGAVEGGFWSGGCTPSIIGRELRRITGTDGTSAASYDHEGVAPLFTCE